MGRNLTVDTLTASYIKVINESPDFSFLFLSICIVVIIALVILWQDERGMRRSYQRLYEAESKHSGKLFSALWQLKKREAPPKKTRVR